MVICIVYFKIFCFSIIWNFSKILEIKVLTINSVPKSSNLSIPLQEENKDSIHDLENPIPKEPIVRKYFNSKQPNESQITKDNDKSS